MMPNRASIRAQGERPGPRFYAEKGAAVRAIYLMPPQLSDLAPA